MFTREEEAKMTDAEIIDRIIKAVKEEEELDKLIANAKNVYRLNPLK